MKVLTLIKKHLFGMCLIALAMASLIFAVRIFNDYRYGAAHTEAHTDLPSYMQQPCQGQAGWCVFKRQGIFTAATVFYICPTSK